MIHPNTTTYRDMCMGVGMAPPTQWLQRINAQTLGLEAMQMWALPIGEMREDSWDASRLSNVQQTAEEDGKRERSSLMRNDDDD
ncbi:hypothetical protein PG993_011912 [Apiospora rasikravindrae]|uniref:Uncharacterized protein n=1 Tax=Apiospora rasikravindrae TaxID=990691 RepID=A0ABR1S0Y2_9PEZI